MNGQVDQEARDLAKEALSDIREHAAVCTEAERRRDLAIEGIREAIDRMEKSYTAQRIDDAARVASAVDSLRQEIAKQSDKQSEVNKSLFGRFWGLLIGWAGSMTAIAGTLAVILIKMVLHV
jgi:hypothetical protein